MGHALKKPTPASAPEAAPQFTVVPPPGAAPAKKSGGLKLGSIGKPAARTGGKSYVAVAGVDPLLVTALLEAKEQMKTLKDGTIPALTADLMETVKPAIHTAANGSQEDSTSVTVAGSQGEQALVTMSKRYSAVPVPEDGEISRIVGEEFVDHFKVGTSLKIDLEKVPEDRQQDLVDALVAAAEGLGCTAAIEAKQVIIPVPGFHARRRLLFTPEQNAALDARVPLVCSVRKR